MENQNEFCKAQLPNVYTTDFEKMTLVYEKAAEHHKYYLTWRQFLLSGFFATISVLLLCMYNIYSAPSLFLRCVTPLIAVSLVLITYFFEFLDNRNKELYQCCQRTAKEIEKELFGDQLIEKRESNKGLFFDLDKSYKLKELLKSNQNEGTSSQENRADPSNPTHSKLFVFFFFIIKLIGIILFLVLAFKIWYLQFNEIIIHLNLFQWIVFITTIIILIGLFIWINRKSLYKTITNL